MKCWRFKTIGTFNIAPLTNATITGRGRHKWNHRMSSYGKPHNSFSAHFALLQQLLCPKRYYSHFQLFLVCPKGNICITYALFLLNPLYLLHLFVLKYLNTHF